MIGDQRMKTNYEELLHRQVVGGLKSGIDSHQDFTPRQLIASQAKRIVHDVVSEHGAFTRLERELKDHYEQRMGWSSFWAGVALGTCFTAMLALLIVRLTAH